MKSAKTAVLSSLVLALLLTACTAERGEQLSSLFSSVNSETNSEVSSFSSSSSSSSSNGSSAVKKNGEQYFLEVPSKTGYKFIGYYIDGKKIPSSGTWVYGDKVPVPRFELINYHISYLLPDDAVNDETNPLSCTIEDKAIELKEPTRKNYIFEGWYLNGEKVTSLNPSEAIDFTLYSVWLEDGSVIKSLTINEKELNLKVTAYKRINAKVETSRSPNDRTKEVTWTSSDSSIATVEKGVIRALKAGKVEIKALCGDKTASVSLTVSPYVFSKEEISASFNNILESEEKHLSSWKKETADESGKKTITYQGYDYGTLLINNDGKEEHCRYYNIDSTLQYHWKKGEPNDAVRENVKQYGGNYQHSSFYAATSSLMVQAWIKSLSENNNLTFNYDGTYYNISYTNEDNTSSELRFKTSARLKDVIQSNANNEEESNVFLTYLSSEVLENEKKISSTTVTDFNYEDYPLSPKAQSIEIAKAENCFNITGIKLCSNKKEMNEIVLSLNHSAAYTIKFDPTSSYSYYDYEKNDSVKADLTNEDVKWVSSDPDIVSVDAKGKLTALKEGKTEIKISYRDFTITCPVNVVKDYSLSSFGVYPQTHVNDSDLITELNKLTEVNEQGFYTYNNEEYAKVKANPFASNYTFEDGTPIVKDSTYWFKVEPIKWLLTEDAENEETLISAKLLTSIKFKDVENSDQGDNRYSWSTLRRYLNSYGPEEDNSSGYDKTDYKNSGFYRSAFNEEEKELINADSLTFTYSRIGGKDSVTLNDKVSVPLKVQIESLLKGTEAAEIKQAEFTDYALATGGHKYENGYGSYWLDNNPDYTFSSYYLEGSSGSIENGKVNLSGIGVRPLIHIAAGGEKTP